MGRGRPKFSFPIPGRKSHANIDESTSNSNISIPVPAQPVPTWSPRLEEPSSSYSKAERILGTAGTPHYPLSHAQSHQSIPQSPGYMTITVSEADSDYTEKSMGIDEGGFFSTKRPSVVRRPSSNILGTGYPDNDRRGSHSSSLSRRLLPKTSNGTMNSHYDAQNSPLAVSQQTSASAVRDRALRKGQAPILTDSPLFPSADPYEFDNKKENRKSKPARLDLSKLFPKPRSSGPQDVAKPLLSPNKLVNSPSAMSTISEYFPRPMTREPTPTPRGHAKLTKSGKRQQVPTTQHQQRPTSPARLHKRDVYDNAKINVRRPPRGIQHWFDGLGDDSDEVEEEGQRHIEAAQPMPAREPPRAPVRQSSLGRLIDNTIPQPRRNPHALAPGGHTKHDPYASAKSRIGYHLDQFSVQSQTSLISIKTKESAFSKTNLQDSSVLSISSSEDEDEREQPQTTRYNVRDSIGSVDDHGDIIIAEAHAFEVRPRYGRRVSESKMSLISTSTNAATIEVMYSPEPPITPQFPSRPSHGNRRSSHFRQPSVIPEDDFVRPKTATQPPISPSTVSVHSMRTSVSEPRRPGHKLMAVTQEEEALLEMMRQKRAAMAKQSFSEGYQTAVKEDIRQRTPPEQTKPLRTSGFLAMDSPTSGPVRVVNTPSRKSVSSVSSPLLLPPPRGRSRRVDQEYINSGTSVLRDSSSCDPASGRRPPPVSVSSFAHQLSPPPELSPLDIFPSTPSRAHSPVPTITEASIASPTTSDRNSTPASPITPGLRHGEADVDVKVAGSEPSYSGDVDADDVAALESGIIDHPTVGMKAENSHSSQISGHRRRRTASSGADIPTFSPARASPQHPLLHDLARVSEASSRTPSIIEPAFPIPKKNSKRVSSLTSSTNPRPRSRTSSTHSAQTSSPSLAPSDRRSSKAPSRGNSITSIKRESVAIGSASTRCSVSEDVLAAWGSLGGMRDYNAGRM
ncbi:hypothetical protein B0J11DRAFT_172051 [Dendryphion nanum]|uniref:Uncharacterized protein n=1 Tax=Dendryphion nanum TaxID=256645 RepID=A0A9P9EDD6_9PLEO|nr:hypothetical protein B0J11DRAFT_172051 [Dendryphion nanum]